MLTKSVQRIWSVPYTFHSVVVSELKNDVMSCSADVELDDLDSPYYSPVDAVSHLFVHLNRSAVYASHKQVHKPSVMRIWSGPLLQKAHELFRETE
jgi:hypothetical protein